MSWAHHMQLPPPFVMDSWTNFICYMDICCMIKSSMDICILDSCCLDHCHLTFKVWPRSDQRFQKNDCLDRCYQDKCLLDKCCMNRCCMDNCCQDNYLLAKSYKIWTIFNDKSCQELINNSWDMATWTSVTWTIVTGTNVNGTNVTRTHV